MTTNTPAPIARPALLKHLAIGLRSDWATQPSDYFCAFVLEIYEDLQARIDAAHALLVADGRMHSVALNVMGFGVLGEEGRSLNGIDLDDAESQRLATALAALRQSSTCEADAALVELLAKASGKGSVQERIVVYRHREPSLQLFEGGDYEGFTSRPLGCLMPTALAAERAAPQWFDEPIEAAA